MGYSGPATVERTAEELLLEFERTGRSDAFEEIVRRYSGMVYHVCYRITRDRHDAEDATQAVFAALAVGRKQGSGEIRTIGPWLRQVARRVSLDIRRGKKRRERRETLCAGNGVAAECDQQKGHGGFDGEELTELVKEELDRLPVKYRLPLVLHYFGGMGQDEMARELACRPGTLRVRLHRARGMLAKRLAKRGMVVSGAVLAVALARAVQSKLTEQLVLRYAYGPSAASSAAGVIQAASGSSMSALHGVAMSKVKIACAVLLVAGCVVRAGAEVYQYIRPLQMRLQTPLNLERLIHPIVDPFVPQLRVDATPIKRPAEKQQAVATVAMGRLGRPAQTPEIVVATAPRIVGIEPSISRPTAAPVPMERPVRVAVAGGPGRTLGQVAPIGMTTPVMRTVPTAALGATPSTGGGGGSAASPTAANQLAGYHPLPFTLAAAVPGTATPTPRTPPAATGVATGAVATDAGGSIPTPSSQGTPPTQENPATPAAPVVIALAPTPPVALPSVVTGSENLTISHDAVGSGAVAFTQSFTTATTFAHVVGTVPSPTVSPAPAAPSATYTVTATSITGRGKVAPADVLDNNGVVTAVAPTAIAAATLDLSAVETITNSVDNPPNGRNGWYARQHARLVLPPIQVERGTHAYSWGESQADPVPDLVNGLRLTPHDVGSDATLRLSLIGPDYPDVPAWPPGKRLLAMWKIEGAPSAAGGLDVLARYDAFDARILGMTEADVRLMEYSAADGWEPAADESVDANNYVVGGHLDQASYFGVAVPSGTAAMQSFVTDITFSSTSVAVTPEPAAATLFLAGSSLLLRRRRRKM